MYIPTQEEVDWTLGMLLEVEDGGLLVMPRIGLVYKVDHENKTLTLQNKMLLAVPDALVLHLQTKEVLNVLHYEIFDGV